jgi:Fe-S-cluster containining protein
MGFPINQCRRPKREDASMPNKKKRGRKGRPVRPTPLAVVQAPEHGGVVGDESPEQSLRALLHGVGRDAFAQALDSAREDGAAPEQALWAGVDSVCAQVEAVMAANPPPRPLACGPGCQWCCFNQVSVTPPEALRIARYVDQELDPLVRGRALARLHGLMPLLKGRGRRELYAMRHQLPCAFLDQGLCAMHPVRPLVCRSWHAVDSEGCRRAFESRGVDDAVEAYEVRRRIPLSVQEGMLQAAADAGLEAGYLLLSRALHRLLAGDVEHAARRWLAGERIFSAGWDS